MDKLDVIINANIKSIGSSTTENIKECMQLYSSPYKQALEELIESYEYVLRDEHYELLYNENDHRSLIKAKRILFDGDSAIA